MAYLQYLCLQSPKAKTCTYTPNPDGPICPAEDQRRLLEHFLDRADTGSAWAANMLRMTPCDLWWAPLRMHAHVTTCLM